MLYESHSLFVGEVYSSCVLFLLEACLYITEEPFSIGSVALSPRITLCACDLSSHNVFALKENWQISAIIEVNDGFVSF